MTANFLPDGTVVVDPEPGVSAAVVLVGPKSRGHLELASRDPLAAPVFHPNYLGDPDDERRCLIGMRLLRRILATEPMASRIISEIAPGPEATSDEALVDHLKAKGSTAWHPTSTCRMGRDDGAVVDPLLRVRGMSGDTTNWPSGDMRIWPPL